MLTYVRLQTHFKPDPGFHFNVRVNRICDTPVIYRLQNFIQGIQQKKLQLLSSSTVVVVVVLKAL